MDHYAAVCCTFYRYFIFCFVCNTPSLSLSLSVLYHFFYSIRNAWLFGLGFIIACLDCNNVHLLPWLCGWWADISGHSPFTGIVNAGVLMGVVCPGPIQYSHLASTLFNIGHYQHYCINVELFGRIGFFFSLSFLILFLHTIHIYFGFTLDKVLGEYFI